MSCIMLISVFLFVGSMQAACLVADEVRYEDESTTTMKDKMIGLTNQIIDLLVDHDISKSVDMFDEQAVLSMEGHRPVKGKEAILKEAKRLSGKIDGMEKQYLDVAPLEEGAPFVYVILTEKWYDYTGKLDGNVKVMFIWKNTEDGYKAYRVMLNSNV